MNKKIWIIIVIAALGMICCIALLVILGSGGYRLFNNLTTAAITPTNITINNLIPTKPSQPENTVTSIPIPTQVDEVSEGAIETLDTLEGTIVPNNDLRDLAFRLQGKENIPETVPAPAKPFQIGDEQLFWANNMDTNTNFRVDTTLQYVTPHLYFWIEKGVDFDKNDLKKLADTFENDIYPTDRQFFGSEWSPGIDNDPHLYVVYAQNLGFSIAGYFSSVDSVNPIAYQYSNAHETFMLNADTIGLGERFTYGVLAHEFQHMIHWYRDRNEDTWLNEGFSELAAFLNGYYESGFDSLYLSDPNLQLNDWPNDPNATTPHYGAAFLFVEYFLERFGDKATQALVANPDNGMDSVDKVLTELGYKDPTTGKQITADDVFTDWVVTNYLDDGKVDDGRYVYNRYSEFLPVVPTDSYSTCPESAQDRQVLQYGAEYIEIACKGNYSVEFQGVTEVGVLPANAHSGDYAFWSNKGDESDITLTQEFDFTGQDGPLTMTYWTWYDLEKDYDYLYLESSPDGERWDILTTPSGTLDNPSGNSYGWGYNGTTDGWIQEKVDISQFAGEKVYLRFEYVTDAAVNGEGFLIDDISIPEINYSTDFESENDGWIPDGFVRIQNRLPQTYILSLIKYGKNTTVEKLQLDSLQHLSIPITFDNDLKKVVLVVSGSTRFTRQPALYHLSIK